MKATAEDVLDISFEVALQAFFVALIFAAGYWLWPDGLLETPIASLTIASLLWASAAVVVYGLAVLAAYFSFLEPFLRRE